MAEQQSNGTAGTTRTVAYFTGVAGAATAAYLLTTTSPVVFRSDTLLPLAVTESGNCLNFKSSVFPDARRPLCATTEFDSNANPMCRITGLRASTCACFEGQAHACSFAGTPCTSGTDCGIKRCMATDDTHASFTGCARAPIPTATTTSVATVPPFRSDTFLPMSVTAHDECLEPKSNVFPNGRRPLCAETSYVSSPSPGQPYCSISGLRSGCVCFEGQAHACNLSAPGEPCTAGGPGCGVMKCQANNDNSSVWGPCTSAP